MTPPAAQTPEERERAERIMRGLVPVHDYPLRHKFVAAIVTELRAAEAAARLAAQERIDDAVSQLDKLADLLADSQEIRVKETPAVSRINDIINMLTPSPPPSSPGGPTGICSAHQHGEDPTCPICYPSPGGPRSQP